MKEEILKKVRDNYKSEKEKSVKLLKYKAELEKLKEDENVKRYLELLKFDDEDIPTERMLIDNAYYSSIETFGKNNKDSNFLMIFMGSYIINGNRTKITYERNPNITYRLYRDLETGKWFNILKNDVLEFEEANTTLYLPILEYSEKEYYQKYMELQNWFKEQLLHRPQKEVVFEIQKNYKRKYKDLYPYFQSIELINNTPIAEYTKKELENDFLENYCISDEEKMVVKLYRKQFKN